jgi:hypothetical protein
VLALFLYVPLAWQIIKGVAKQNLATWILWGLLDLVVGVSLYVQGGNWYLLGAYVSGCILTVACLLYSGERRWTWFETTIFVMVIICLVGWYYSGSRTATILSTSGVALATLPLWKDAYLKPDMVPLGIYVGFSVANTLATIGGAAWTVEERLYPATCVVLTIVIVMLTAIRRYIHPYLRYRRHQFI